MLNIYADVCLSSLYHRDCKVLLTEIRIYTVKKIKETFLDACAQSIYIPRYKFHVLVLHITAIS